MSPVRADRQNDEPSTSVMIEPGVPTEAEPPLKTH